MNASPITVYCPYCNAKGHAQPVLSPMRCDYVKARPLPAGVEEMLQAPFYQYTCERCGYHEIHDNYFAGPRKSVA